MYFSVNHKLPTDKNRREIVKALLRSRENETQ